MQIYGNVGKGSNFTSTCAAPEPVMVQNIAYDIPVQQNPSYAAASCENVTQNSTTDM